MSQDNQFHQYGYDQYLKTPKRAKSAPAPGGIGTVLAQRFSRLNSPATATAALLVAGAVFAGIIVMAYPSADREDGEIPIVRADLRPMKAEPEDRGGMEIPNRDSTVLADMGQNESEGEREIIENLLQKTDEQDYVSKEKALESALSENPYSSEMSASEEDLAALNDADTMEPVDQAVASMQEETPVLEPEPVKLAEVAPPVQPAPTVEKTAPNSILQKIEPKTEKPIAPAVKPSAPEKPKMHAAATSPETLDFVRNVLNENEETTRTSPSSGAQANAAPKVLVESAPVAAAPAPAKIEPAAGIASNTSASAVSNGGYYVQLASISDRARADSEWKKMQAKYGALSGVSYRVQEAAVSGKGTFYRIQAGPFSKDTANSICGSIKAQNPGGCLVAK